MENSGSGRRVYLIVQTVLLILTAVLLILTARGIYLEGAAERSKDALADIYTREKAAEGFAPIAPLFFGTIGMSAAGLLLGIKSPLIGGRRSRTARPVSSVPKAKREGKRGNGARRPLRVIRIVLLAAALVMILMGMRNGSMRDVLVKAVNLCTECVGLG